jgi:hypothetical protein
MVEKYKILEVGNVYFPLMDRLKEFIVEDTITVVLGQEESKRIIEFRERCKDINSSYHVFMAFRELWNTLQKDKKLMKKKVWLCPTLIDFDGDFVVCTVDVLKPIKNKTKRFKKGSTYK